MTPIKLAITKAAAPITGGINCPFTDDDTSIAPAFSFEKPVFFIIGIVKVPVVTVFAIEDPEIKPVIPDPKIAALAGPPLIFPTIAKAKSKKYFPPPAVSRSAPNKTNKKIKSTETPIGIPNIASWSSHWKPTNLFSESPPWEIISGAYLPKYEKSKKQTAMITKGKPIALLVASSNIKIPKLPRINSTGKLKF